jgi:hypothetical protein
MLVLFETWLGSTMCLNQWLWGLMAKTASGIKLEIGLKNLYTGGEDDCVILFDV